MRTFKGQVVTRDESNPADYPFDKIKDKVVGVQSGTPAQEKITGDLYQAFYEILRIAGITPDETPEKKESSQVADAVFGMQPVAIVRVGYNEDDAEMQLFTGIYQGGYTATFVEGSVTSIKSSCALSIMKDGVLSTEDYIATISPATQREDPPTSFELAHGDDSAGYATPFFSNGVGNVIAHATDSATTAEMRNRTQFVIAVHKI